MSLNFSNFPAPSRDDTCQCEILFAAYADNNSILVDLGEFEQHSMLLLREARVKKGPVGFNYYSNWPF